MYQNRVEVIGNLTRKPELKQTGSVVLVGLNIAVNSTWIDKTTNEKKESVEYISVTVFGKQAENCAQWLEKGQKVYVEGKIKNRVEETPDGKRYHTGIVAERVQFGSKPVAKEVGDTTYENNSANKTVAPAKQVNVQSSIEYPTEKIDPADIPF